MAAFLYRAVSPDGRPQRGVIEAPSEPAARQSLRARNLLPVSLEATATGAARRPALGGRQLALVTRQLATLIGTDVRIDDALRTVAAQSRPRAAALLLNLRAAILEGRGLAAALADYPAAFSGYYRASIAAGEQSGRLALVLQHLSDYVEARQKNAQTLQLALIYPALLALVSLAIIAMLLTYVVPDIVRVFVARGADLPLLTRGLIAVSGGLRSYGLVGLGALAALGLAARGWLARPGNRRAWHRLLATGPATAAMVRQINAAQFAGTLATLVQSGVPLLDALRAAAAATPNLHIRAAVEQAASRVQQGASLLTALTEAAVFPPMLLAMVASGEASGTLGPALARAAADQQRQLDALVATLVALVEPGVLLVMGGMVLMMVLSILMPIIKLNDLAGL